MRRELGNDPADILPPLDIGGRQARSRPRRRPGCQASVMSLAGYPDSRSPTARRPRSPGSPRRSRRSACRSRAPGRRRPRRPVRPACTRRRGGGTSTASRRSGAPPARPLACAPGRRTGAPRRRPPRPRRAGGGDRSLRPPKRPRQVSGVGDRRYSTIAATASASSSSAFRTSTRRWPGNRPSELHAAATSMGSSPPGESCSTDSAANRARSRVTAASTFGQSLPAIR